MDAWNLRVFEAVARHSSAHRAALELNTVQSNVTMRIRQLEAELGIALFKRNTKGMVLTPAGRRLLPYAIEVQTTLRKAKLAVAEQGIPSGPLVIGTLQSILANHLTSIVSPYISKYPDVDISLRTGTTPEILDQVLNNDLEGAFIYGPVQHPELVSEVIFDDELVIYSAASLSNLNAISVADCRMIVLRSGWNRKRLEAILMERGLKDLRVLELGTLEAVFDCVSAGLGVTLLPKSLPKSVFHQGKVRVHKISENADRVDTIFIRRTDGFVSSALITFLDFARGTKYRLQKTAE